MVGRGMAGAERRVMVGSGKADMVWQARWVKAWCSEVCCGLLGLGRHGKFWLVAVGLGKADMVWQAWKRQNLKGDKSWFTNGKPATDIRSKLM